MWEDSTYTRTPASFGMVRDRFTSTNLIHIDKSSTRVCGSTIQVLFFSSGCTIQRLSGITVSQRHLMSTLINLFTLSFAARWCTCDMPQKRNQVFSISALLTGLGPCCATVNLAVVLARRQGPPFLGPGFATVRSFETILTLPTPVHPPHMLRKANFCGA